MSQLYARNRVADYLVPIETDPLEILVSAPKKENEPFACFNPFQIRVKEFLINIKPGSRLFIKLNYTFFFFKTWIAVAAVIVFLPFFFWIYEKQGQWTGARLSGSSLTDYFLFVYRILLGQSNSFSMNVTQILFFTISGN